MITKKQVSEIFDKEARNSERAFLRLSLAEKREVFDKVKSGAGATHCFDSYDELEKSKHADGLIKILAYTARGKGVLWV